MYEDGMEVWVNDTPWMGFAIQRLGFGKECWTVLLMQDTAEFFQWLNVKKQFIISRCQANQTIYIVPVSWLGNMMIVKQSLGQWILFKATDADLDMLRSWLLGETVVTISEFTQQPFSPMTGSLSG